MALALLHFPRMAECATEVQGCPAGCILAIDPGLDAAGLAVYDLARYQDTSDVLDLRRAIVHVSTVRTAPDTPLELRLGQLADGVASLVRAHGIARVYLERPAITGTYQRNRAELGREVFGALMGALHLATGALTIAARAAGAEVEFVAAPRLKKEQRHVLARAIVADTDRLGLGKRLPSKDALDAVWLGAQQLTGPIALERRRARGRGLRRPA